MYRSYAGTQHRPGLRESQESVVAGHVVGRRMGEAEKREKQENRRGRTRQRGCPPGWFTVPVCFWWSPSIGWVLVRNIPGLRQNQRLPPLIQEASCPRLTFWHCGNFHSTWANVEWKLSKRYANAKQTFSQCWPSMPLMWRDWILYLEDVM